MSNNSTNSKSCMIYPIVPFPVTFQGHGDALHNLCAQLTSDVFAIAKVLVLIRCDDARDKVQQSTSQVQCRPNVVKGPVEPRLT